MRGGLARPFRARLTHAPRCRPQAVSQTSLSRHASPRGAAASALAGVRSEAALLASLRHPRVLRLVELIDDDRASKLYLVLAFCAGGPAQAPGGAALAPGEAARVARDAALGLAYCHAHGGAPEMRRGDAPPRRHWEVEAARCRTALAR